MCGITGILQTPRASRSADLAAIGPMTARLRHRGPDADGFWSDRDAGVAFGHRRLSIIDLSDAGRQPMLSSDGRFVITFNGEIYNYKPLRQELECAGKRFIGNSDTEVLLGLIEKWGLEKALQRCNGMFAIGLWDRRNRTLHLARDRMGKKPLYVARTSNAVVFASELKAIAAFPDFHQEIDPGAVAEFLTRGWLPEDQCIWRGVFKIPPGGALSIRAEDLSVCRDAAALQERARSWWSLADVAHTGRAALATADDQQLVSQACDLLKASVADRMVADVPVGLFLSGGIDSSTVVALMQAQSARPVRTFTIGFGERAFDETANAAAVARHLGTSHTELRLTSADARAVIPELPTIWDEPFADESQIPTLLLSRLARQDVTVALSGDGGDECFGGYSRHVLSARLAPLLNSNRSIRTMAAGGVALLGRGMRESVVETLRLPGWLQRMTQGDRINRLADLIGSNDVGEMYRRSTRLSELQLTRTQAGSEPDSIPPLNDLLSDFIVRDMLGYLPSDILVKLDRASMATSLEARCPLLDHRVVEFSWALPNSAKVRHGQGKWLLRQVLGRYLPRHLFERPKQGFDVPIGSWLKGPLRSWASDLLSESRLRNQHLLDVSRVQECWLQHLSGRRDFSRPLWAVLMLQSWLDSAVTSGPSRTAGVMEPAQ
ncbi:asparagine synthase (glutamine-hydrolyzing) [Bradyrhizobium japonicum]|uniref:asparagine synthase (glutamine-hydrolyzing) n=1 Tax=Bradyrhizobium TaxID=374 RepID=UPI00041AF99E|nr:MULTISPECIES: asparagine synthase (glutamine-hydrolyzing) [Bradyrhizobium]MBR0875936.1 asparagine synthase (glutamine-hydrolyzing) [Bradyrhizobium liaoningense]MBR0939745.1 asparagine synthase (glutamine-hydrolyzing) [Bradyrhizobium liaoningense]MBR0997021.1 asparagine synthase (glutamine-hydrolyzing) [Bradyrhizobium liaoningense]MBR1025385.1 asparagine synthase (glutamine-hydrolyzing) [Bradyrhizobium liaoningense]MBR1062436.1 asparagine synthase (glutamine-hydrolyzing) [Bradyrhizobium liao